MITTQLSPTSQAWEEPRAKSCATCTSMMRRQAAAQEQNVQAGGRAEEGGRSSFVPTSSGPHVRHVGGNVPHTPTRPLPPSPRSRRGAGPQPATSPPPAAAAPVREKERLRASHIRCSPAGPFACPAGRVTSSPVPPPQRRGGGGGRSSGRSLPPSLPSALPPLPSAAASRFVSRVSVGSPRRVAR